MRPGIPVMTGLYARLTMKYNDKVFRRLYRGAILLVLLLPVWVHADELPVLKLSVLQYGTAHWELDHIQREGLDRQAGFALDVRLVANLPASRIAVSSGDVHGAVVDLTWTQASFAAGERFLYVPYSSQIGNVLAAPQTPIDRLDDLKGKRIGVAGGPDSKGWIILNEAARQRGIDLSQEASIQYAAPPLLNQALLRGQLDVLVTFWNFAAELTASGSAYTAVDMQVLMQELGLAPQLPILGYVFRETWAKDNAALLERFVGAITTAKDQLASEPQHWEALRPLMRFRDEAHFDALRQGFIEGIPKPLSHDSVRQLQQLLILTGVEAGSVMSDTLFYCPDC